MPILSKDFPVCPARSVQPALYVLLAAVFPDGSEETCQGTIEGQIAYAPAGENGFGYDPIFYVPEYDCTTAQLTPEQKNEISHRGKALKAMKEVIRQRIVYPSGHTGVSDASHGHASSGFT